jgi:hypothetical protein
MREAAAVRDEDEVDKAAAVPLPCYVAQQLIWPDLTNAATPVEPRDTYSRFIVHDAAGNTTSVCVDTGCSTVMADKTWLATHFPDAEYTRVPDQNRGGLRRPVNTRH